MEIRQLARTTPNVSIPGSTGKWIVEVDAPVANLSHPITVST